MYDNNETEPITGPVSSEAEEQEPGHFEKAAGVFTEPNATFAKASRFKPKTTDWLIPVLLFIVIALLSNILLMSRPNIKYQVRQEQEKKLMELVQQGKLSEEQAEIQLSQMDKMYSGVFLVIQIISTFIIVFISFFVVTGVYYLISRFILKGDGTFTSALSANGLSTYISALQMLLILIISMIADRLFKALSIADFLSMDKTSVAGYLLSKIDPLTIWAFVILSIGLSKMFHSDDNKKYYIAVFGTWILWSLIIFGLSKAVPMLSPLTGA